MKGWLTQGGSELLSGPCGAAGEGWGESRTGAHVALSRRCVRYVALKPLRHIYTYISYHIIYIYHIICTNIGRTFLKILDEEFPKGYVLHKIFNRNTVKISYSCMTNLKQNIDGHNKSPSQEDCAIKNMQL